MPGQPVMAGAVLTAGLRAEFADTYQVTYDVVKSRLSSAMQLGLPSDKLEEIYGYFESAPYPQRWPRGETIATKGMRSRQFRITNFDYGRRIQWHENDRMDDQTKTLFDQARMLGMHFATLPERIFFQILTAATDSSLLPSIPTAPDGAALYATTAGGAARFGVSGGNIVTSSGLSSPSAVRTDFWSAVSKFRQFRDTEGQPLWSDYLLDSGYLVIAPAAYEEVFRAAFRQTLTAAGALSSTSNAGVTNLILDTGVQVDLWLTQRLTSTQWYVFLKGAPKKAIVQQVRAPLREAYATVDTSDEVRDTKMEYIQWDCREGYGVALPYQTVAVA